MQLNFNLSHFEPTKLSRLDGFQLMLQSVGLTKQFVALIPWESPCCQFTRLSCLAGHHSGPFRFDPESPNGSVHLLGVKWWERNFTSGT